MSGPSANQLVLFPSSPNDFLNFVPGDIKTLGKTNFTVQGPQT